MRGGVAGTADPATLDTSKASLTRRASEDGKLIPLRSTDWAFADCSKTAFPGTPDPQKVCLKGGFNPAYLYELVYTAKDPKVYGIGFAATRDLNSYLRYAAKDDTGADNILSGRITHTVSQGDSQSGNYLRSFIHLGFNQDESGRMVFEGSNPNIAVRLLAMNIRFAAPSGATAMYEPGSDGIVWWSDYSDDARHRDSGGLLDRCRATETCPKIVETFGSAEFYSLRASPDLVGTTSGSRYPSAFQRAPLLLPRSESRRRARRVRSWSSRPGLLRTAAEPESVQRHIARHADSAGGVGGEGHAASAEPVSAPGSRRVSCADAGVVRIPCDSGNALARWSAHASL